MKKIAHWLSRRIIPILILGLTGVIGWAVFAETNDTPQVAPVAQNANVLVTSGRLIFTRKTTKILKNGESQILQVGDTLKTLVASSATISWPDGSITRMSEKTGITISSLSVASDLSSVLIRFDTKSGKTWSNVIRSLMPDSFFEQTYDHGNYVATVRGTVFEVNLDKNYVHTVNHAIAIKSVQS